MNDARRLRALQAVGINVAHHIVTALPLPALRILIIDVVLVRFQLGNLFVRDVQALLLFSLRQGDPQLAPSAEFIVLGKNELHLLAGISGRKRTDIMIVGHDAYLRCFNILQNEYTAGNKKMQRGDESYLATFDFSSSCIWGN